jgi:hypothetical protein
MNSIDCSAMPYAADCSLTSHSARCCLAALIRLRLLP